jgi:hypothetical protein
MRKIAVEIQIKDDEHCSWNCPFIDAHSKGVFCRIYDTKLDVPNLYFAERTAACIKAEIKEG